MTKADIVERIHTTMGVPRKDSYDLLESALSIIKSTLEAGEKIKIAGFGNFEVRQMKDRIGRNPQTGEALAIPSRRVLTFKPSDILRRFINK